MVALLLPCWYGDHPPEGAAQPGRRGATARGGRRAVHDHRLRASGRRARPRACSTVGIQRSTRRPMGDAPGPHTRGGSQSARRAAHRPLDYRLTVAVLLDTSVLIAAEKGPDEDAAISVVSLT